MNIFWPGNMYDKDPRLNFFSCIYVPSNYYHGNMMMEGAMLWGV